MKHGFRVKAYKHPRLKFVVRGKVSGKWERRYFETKGEANTYAQQQNTRLLNEGRDGIEFPSWLRLSAERGHAALLPYGKTIDEAVDYFVAHLEQGRRAAPIKTAVDELIENRRRHTYNLYYDALGRCVSRTLDNGGGAAGSNLNSSTVLAIRSTAAPLTLRTT